MNVNNAWFYDSMEEDLLRDRTIGKQLCVTMDDVCCYKVKNNNNTTWDHKTAMTEIDGH